MPNVNLAQLQIAVQNLQTIIETELNNRQIVFKEDGNPIIDGYSAPEASYYWNTSTRVRYEKIGPLDTDWQIVGSGGGGGVAVQNWEAETIYNSFTTDGVPSIVWVQDKGSLYINKEDFTSSATFDEDLTLNRWYAVNNESQNVLYEDNPVSGTLLVGNQYTGVYITGSSQPDLDIEIDMSEQDAYEGREFHVFAETPIRTLTFTSPSDFSTSLVPGEYVSLRASDNSWFAQKVGGGNTPSDNPMLPIGEWDMTGVPQNATFSESDSTAIIPTQDNNGFWSFEAKAEAPQLAGVYIYIAANTNPIDLFSPQETRAFALKTPNTAIYSGIYNLIIPESANALSWMTQALLNQTPVPGALIGASGSVAFTYMSNGVSISTSFRVYQTPTVADEEVFIIYNNSTGQISVNKPSDANQYDLGILSSSFWPEVNGQPEKARMYYVLITNSPDFNAVNANGLGKIFTGISTQDLNPFTEIGPATPPVNSVEGSRYRVIVPGSYAGKPTQLNDIVEFTANLDSIEITRVIDDSQFVTQADLLPINQSLISLTTANSLQNQFIALGKPLVGISYDDIYWIKPADSHGCIVGYRPIYNLARFNPTTIAIKNSSAHIYEINELIPRRFTLDPGYQVRQFWDQSSHSGNYMIPNIFSLNGACDPNGDGSDAVVYMAASQAGLTFEIGGEDTRAIVFSFAEVSGNAWMSGNYTVTGSFQPYIRGAIVIHDVNDPEALNPQTTMVLGMDHLIGQLTNKFIIEHDGQQVEIHQISYGNNEQEFSSRMSGGIAINLSSGDMNYYRDRSNPGWSNPSGFILPPGTYSISAMFVDASTTEQQGGFVPSAYWVPGQDWQVMSSAPIQSNTRTQYINILGEITPELYFQKYNQYIGNNTIEVFKYKPGSQFSEVYNIIKSADINSYLALYDMSIGHSLDEQFTRYNEYYFYTSPIPNGGVVYSKIVLDQFRNLYTLPTAFADFIFLEVNDLSYSGSTVILGSDRNQARCLSKIIFDNKVETTPKTVTVSTISNGYTFNFYEFETNQPVVTSLLPDDFNFGYPVDNIIPYSKFYNRESYTELTYVVNTSVMRVPAGTSYLTLTDSMLMEPRVSILLTNAALGQEFWIDATQLTGTLGLTDANVFVMPYAPNTPLVGDVNGDVFILGNGNIQRIKLKLRGIVSPDNNTFEFKKRE